MPVLQQRSQELPLPIVGSTKFGRYQKISVEQTFNMLISDNSLVDYAGYSSMQTISANQKGRSLYSSANANLMVAVVGNGIYVLDQSLSVTLVGTTVQNTGNVFIAENNANQIAITDGAMIYIINYGGGLPTLFLPTLPPDFEPGYMTFQNGRFIFANNATNQWILGPLGAVTAMNIQINSQTEGLLQTKPDTVQAVVRFPGRGNLLFVFGKTVTESWSDVGANLFPYQRNSSFNVDYGCISPNTIAENEDIVVWLAGNEQSGASIMMSNGTDIKKISTDGIDFKLSQLTAPEDSYGFLFRQDGHVIYQLTFPTDNLSYIYDFNTDKFFTVTDEYLNYHITRKVVFFNNNYYFVSFNDGNIYEFGTQFTFLQYANNIVKEMPRIRIIPPFRFPNQKWFIGRSAGFTVENGNENPITPVPVVVPGIGYNIITENDMNVYGGDNIVEEGATNNSYTQIVTESSYYLNDYATNINVSNMVIDLTVSRDGGQTFGSASRYPLNPTGVRKSMILFQRLGIVNDLTLQFRFWGFQRYVAFDGVLEVYQ